jgi:hypothetical protein
MKSNYERIIIKVLFHKTIIYIELLRNNYFINYFRIDILEDYLYEKWRNYER